MRTDESDLERDQGALDARPATAPGAQIPPNPDEPVRHEGNIPKAALDEYALRVIRRLNSFGHEAYLVGGCVRDLLAGLEPKDFDVVTDARPNRIKRLFRNARIIGRRFRLAHILFGPDHVIETSTFRATPAEADGDGDGAQIPEPPAEETMDPRARRRHVFSSENVFGTAPEDARRRDFTINALFYDPLRNEILDWVGGFEDLEAGIVRSIGDPVLRLREDPVRMIRAVHFAERMGFRLEPSLEQAVGENASWLRDASPARLYVELIKVLNRARARPTLHRLHEMGALRHWLPELSTALDATTCWPGAGGGTHEEASHGEPEDLPTAHSTWNLLGAADRWGMGTRGADDALVLASLLGPWILGACRNRSRRLPYAAFSNRFDEMLGPMARRMSIPRRTTCRLRDLLWLSLELHQPPEGRRVSRIVHRPAFPLALGYLYLDLMARDCPPDVFEAWEALAPEHPVDVRPPARQSRGDRRREQPRRQRGGERRGRRQRGARGRGDRGRAGQGGAPREEADAWKPAPDESPDASPEKSRERPGTPSQPSRRRRRRKSTGAPPSSSETASRPPPPTDPFANGLE